MSDVLVAKESFTTTIDGDVYTVRKGLTRVSADHALARQNPEYFEEPANDVTYGIEQATEAPGEKRAAELKAAKAKEAEDKKAADEAEKAKAAEEAKKAEEAAAEAAKEAEAKKAKAADDKKASGNQGKAKS